MHCRDLALRASARVSTRPLLRLACWLSLLCPVLAVGQPWEPESARTPQEFDAILNDLSYMDMAPRLSKVEAARFKLDGYLDEGFWSEAVGFSKFYVVRPSTLSDPRYETHVKLVYSDFGLHVAFLMRQPSASLLERQTGRDGFRGVARDEVGFAFDASGEGRFGYFFRVALGGSMSDGTIRPERRFKTDWDGAWEATTRRTENGWNAEFLIPWSVVSLPRTGLDRRLGFRFWRVIGYTGEELAWPALPDRFPKFLSAFQPVLVQDISPTNKYQFVPYASSSYREAQSSYQARAGLDASWRPSSNFQITSSLYPDFGNVEADNQTVNLTAFEQFFPEKRIFFQEGMDLFVTSPRSSSRWMSGYNAQPIYMLHTRRIGGKPRRPKLEDNQTIEDRAKNLPTELYGTAKMTGQTGAVEYGLLLASEQDELFNVIETAEDGQQRRIDLRGAGQDFAVARLKYERREESGNYFGIGSFSGAVSHPRENAFVQGVDLHFLSPGGLWQADGQVIHSDTDSHGTGFAAHAEAVRNPGSGIRHALAFAYMDDSFDLNDIGYHRRNDFLMLEWRRIRRQADHPKFREFESTMGIFQRWNGDRRVIRAGYFYAQEMELRDLREIQWSFRVHPPTYEDWNTRGNGTYKKKSRFNLNASLSSDGSKPFSGSAYVEVGSEDLGGMSYGGGIRSSWRPNQKTDVSARFSLSRTFGWVLHHEDREMAEFDSVDLGQSLEFSYYPGEAHQLSAVFRWNLVRNHEMNRFVVPERPDDLIKFMPAPGAEPLDFSASFMTIQLRYRWEIAPLTDLFVVYSRISDDRFDGRPDIGDVAQEVWDNPLYADLLVKFRYRLGNF